MWTQVGFINDLLYILVFQIIRCDAEPPNPLPLWTWMCVDDRCVPFHATSTSNLQSLQMCNMLCASMQLWPQPTGPVSLATTAIPVRADLFHLQTVETPSKVVQEHLEEAFQLFRDDLHLMEINAVGLAQWRSVAVHVTINGSEDARMRLDTDESYSLVMHPEFKTGGPITVTINAKSFCGARHALETLHQLVWLDQYAATLFMLEAAKIEDAPRFSYRGLLLDTSRNFFPVHDIIRTIDGMAANKLNTFHWHISDAQSFPLRFSSVPDLANYGAYGPGAIYTPEDVSKIASRARLRGIRILLEVDTPAHVGHSWDWGSTLGFGDMSVCAGTDDWYNYCPELPCGQLNPENTNVYNVLEAIYAEIIQLTGVDDIFHLGGDDVSEACWKKHFPNNKFEELLTYYTKSALKRLEIANGNLPNLTILWDSLLHDELQNYLYEYSDHIGFQTRGLYGEKRSGVDRFHIGGNRKILSNAEAWDLNSGMGEWYENTNGAPYNSWQRMYELRPWARGYARERIVGAEVTAWAARLSVGGLDWRLWPRAAAFAERVWSDRPEGATRAVHVRLDVQRARLLARGLHPAPIWSAWCSHHTYTCG